MTTDEAKKIMDWAKETSTVGNSQEKLFNWYADFCEKLIQLAMESK